MRLTWAERCKRAFLIHVRACVYVWACVCVWARERGTSRGTSFAPASGDPNDPFYLVEFPARDYIRIASSATSTQKHVTFAAHIFQVDAWKIKRDRANCGKCAIFIRLWWNFCEWRMFPRDAKWKKGKKVATPSTCLCSSRGKKFKRLEVGKNNGEMLSRMWGTRGGIS